jgi:hypothetical protein
MVAAMRSAAGEALARHEAVKADVAKVVADMRARMGPRPTLEAIRSEMRYIYELSKIAYHAGHISFEHLEKIRKQLEICEDPRKEP